MSQTPINAALLKSSLVKRFERIIARPLRVAQHIWGYNMIGIVRNSKAQAALARIEALDQSQAVIELGSTVRS